MSARHAKRSKSTVVIVVVVVVVVVVVYYGLFASYFAYAFYHERNQSESLY